MKSFKDHFSGHAAGYARYRPGYPDQLFAYLARLCREHALAWDCGTGNGQAALGLATHFERVVATDASAEQIANATAHERVAYVVAPAEHSPLSSSSVDLVTVAQALHWFDIEAFFDEVRRVLKPDGVVAVWAYGMCSVAPSVDAVLDRFYEQIVGPFWPPERALIEEGYRSIPFPFEEASDVPGFHLEAVWTLDEMLGYLGTWSATQRFVKLYSVDPVAAIRDELVDTWGKDEPKVVRWPLYLRVGYVRA